MVDVVVTTMGWDVMDGMGWYYGYYFDAIHWCVSDDIARPPSCYANASRREKKTKRENRRFGNGCFFFWGVRIHYHTIQTWLGITVRLESEKPGLDIWKFISHASSQINHWGIRALCRIMGMRPTFFFANFLSCNNRWRFSDFSIKWRSSFLIGTCQHHPQPRFRDLFGSGGSHERVPVLVHCWGPGREVEVMTPSVSRSVRSFSKMSNKLHFLLKLTSRPWK